ncbi:MAG: hypothetical protein WC595_01385 [Candidatus Nanoarchaeia archaeon]
MKTALTKITTDHGEMRKWVKERKGHPIHLKGMLDADEIPISIKLPHSTMEGSEITWDEFFKQFDDRNLAFEYEERDENGELSLFFKLIKQILPEAQPELEIGQVGIAPSDGVIGSVVVPPGSVVI